jgi:Ca2+-binding RTX toxin-like protein
MAYVKPYYGDFNNTIPTNDSPPAGPYDGMFGYFGNDVLVSNYLGEVYLDGGPGDDRLQAIETSGTWGTFLGGTATTALQGDTPRTWTKSTAAATTTFSVGAAGRRVTGPIRSLEAMGGISFRGMTGTIRSMAARVTTRRSCLAPATAVFTGMMGTTSSTVRTVTIGSTGGLAHDTLYGGAGNDTLIGGEGFGLDKLEGGAGDDTYQCEGNDTLVEALDGGTDTVVIAQNYELREHFENLRLSGTAISGKGNSVDNRIEGNASANTLQGLDGNDTLDGGLGADTMDGGGGDNTFVVNEVGDVIVEGVAGGRDTVVASIDYSLVMLPLVENLTLSGGAVTGTGNAAANRIVGNGLANTLDGGAGADTLEGGGGDETYMVGESADMVVEADRAGVDRVVASASYVLSENVEILELAGAAVAGTGNGLDNLITGNDLANILDGGSGADTLKGGLGDDIYVTDGLDTLTGETGGTDTVVSSSLDSVLAPEFENLSLTGPALTGTGNGASNRLLGNDLVNTLSGDAGNDTLDGGAGADRLEGGADNDTYHTDGLDALVEAAGGGTDTVLASGNCTLAAELENLTLTGAARGRTCLRSTTARPAPRRPARITSSTFQAPRATAST